MSSGVGGALGYEFDSDELATLALTHRSYAAEHELDVSYERLEFLGDAVLQLAVTRHLYDAYAHLAEGELAKVRAAVVNQKALATVGRNLGIGEFMLLGQGEERSGGRDKDSILADVVEALLGAIYLDGGYEPASDLVLRWLVPLIGERAASPGELDFKTRLQEVLAQRGLLPRYVISESGPDHAKSFTAELWVEGEIIATGSGSSKKRAEQSAASNAAASLFES
ncbi:MAG: ribonuclease III [bacterium]|nr:ribonuclease III [bacterium]MCP4964881.1 ribonuclease III [bacterium]